MPSLLVTSLVPAVCHQLTQRPGGKIHPEREDWD